jgi:hypothetical protein
MLTKSFRGTDEPRLSKRSEHVTTDQFKTLFMVCSVTDDTRSGLYEAQYFIVAGLISDWWVKLLPWSATPDDICIHQFDPQMKEQSIDRSHIAWAHRKFKKAPSLAGKVRERFLKHETNSFDLNNKERINSKFWSVLCYPAQILQKHKNILTRAEIQNNPSLA